MGNRLTKIYTRTGDNGTTGMADGSRVSKADMVFSVMGDVDELNAHIGMISAHISRLNNDLHSPQNSEHQYNRAADNTDENHDIANNDVASQSTALLHALSLIQHLLFNVGGELAMPEYKGVNDNHITWLEDNIDALNHALSPLKDFILPAGSILVSQIHIARTVCRRAERQAVHLKQHDSSGIGTNALKLLNRLSDWLFVLSRYCAKLEGSGEVLWDKNILDELITK